MKLNAALLRLARGMISALEEWLREQAQPPIVEINPDPVKHFQQHK